MTELEQILMEKLEVANEQNKQLTEQLALLTEQVQLLTQKLFGRSSEKSKLTAPVENQLSLFTDEDLNVFNEAEIDQDKKAPEISRLEDIKVNKRTVGQKEKLIKNLPVVNVNCLLHDEESHCEWCNTALKIIGKEEIRQEIEFIPAHLKVRKIMRYAYECPTCKKDGEDSIVKALTPTPVIPRSLASASSVAWLMHQKFELSIPFYRQEKEWENYGIILSRATMANWVIKASNLWLKPMYDLLHKQLLQSRAIHVDETTMQVLKEPNRKATSKSYMWLYQSSKDSPEQMALYDYKPTRAGENARKFLEGYRGFMHCDGYEGYNKVTDVTRVGCWAHLRRKFNDGIPKNSLQNKSQSEIGKDFCDQLFKVEREIAYLSPKERLIQRTEKATPILTKFWNWVEQTNALKSSILGKALQYAKNQKLYLMRMIDYKSLNKDLYTQQIKDRNRQRYEKNSLIEELWTDEAQALLALPETVYPVRRELIVTTNKYYEILFDNTKIHIPRARNHSLLTAYLTWDKYKIVSGNGEIIGERFFELIEKKAEDSNPYQVSWSAYDKLTKRVN